MRSHSSIKFLLLILAMAISVTTIAGGYAVDITQATETQEVAIAFSTKGMRSVLIISTFI